MATRTEHAARRRAFWLAHFEARAGSELSVKAYAAQHGLSVGTYYAAHKRYRCGPAQVPAPGRRQSALVSPRFARVMAAAVERSGRVLCRARLANGAHVELECDGASV